MNKFKEFAKIFGLELEEEFHVKDAESNEIYEDIYKFTSNCLTRLYKGGWVKTDDRELAYDFLRGNYDVVKIPWKPKEGENYHYYSASNDFKCSVLRTWRGTGMDFAFWKSGNCFRTGKEAKEKGEEILKQIKKEYEEA